jgi:hypothetical protein
LPFTKSLSFRVSESSGSKFFMLTEELYRLVHSRLCSISICSRGQNMITLAGFEDKTSLGEVHLNF